MPNAYQIARKPLSATHVLPTAAERRTLAALLVQAEARGRVAYAEGRQSAPALDLAALASIIRAVGGIERGTVKILDAWSKGWHAANGIAIFAACE